MNEEQTEFPFPYNEEETQYYMDFYQLHVDLSSSQTLTSHFYFSLDEIQNSKNCDGLKNVRILK